MIYWQIMMPGKPWSRWSDGTAVDVLDAQVDAMISVLDDEHQLKPPFDSGVNVEMFKCVSLDDFHISQDNARTFRTNYLGIREGDKAE